MTVDGVTERPQAAEHSPTNSAKSWDYDTLAGQIQALWVLRRAG